MWDASEKRCADKNKRKAVENGGESADLVWFWDGGTEGKKEASALEICWASLWELPGRVGSGMETLTTPFYLRLEHVSLRTQRHQSHFDVLFWFGLLCFALYSTDIWCRTLSDFMSCWCWSHVFSFTCCNIVAICLAGISCKVKKHVVRGHEVKLDWGKTMPRTGLDVGNWLAVDTP